MNRDKIIYKILNEVEVGNTDINENTYGIEKKEFGEIIEEIIKNGYFVDKCAYVLRAGYPYDPFDINITQAKLSTAGRAYLKNNSWTGKAHRTAKEVKSWLK